MPGSICLVCPALFLLHRGPDWSVRPGGIGQARSDQRHATTRRAGLAFSQVLHCADSWEVDFTVHKAGLAISFSRVKSEGLSPFGVRGQRAAKTGPSGHVTKPNPKSYGFLIQTSCDGSDLVHSQLFARWRAAGAGHVAHRRPQLFAHVFTFRAKSLKSFLKPVTSHLHQVIPFSLSLFLVHAGHLDGSHRGWCGRGRGQDTCWRRQSPPSWFPAAGHTSRPCAVGVGRGGHEASRGIGARRWARGTK